MDSITATSTQGLSVPLRAWPSSKPGQDSLPFLIARINRQKRSFRDMSEQSLEGEIQALRGGESPSKNDEPVLKEEPTNSKTKREEMQVARQGIIDEVMYGVFSSLIEVIDANRTQVGPEGDLVWLRLRFPGALQAYT